MIRKETELPVFIMKYPKEIKTISIYYYLYSSPYHLQYLATLFSKYMHSLLSSYHFLYIFVGDMDYLFHSIWYTITQPIHYKTVKKTFSKHVDFVFLLILSFATLFLFCFAIRAPYISDDVLAIQNNPTILHFPQTIYYFSFVQPILYWVIANLFGNYPEFFRLVSIFFHLGSVYCAYYLLSRLYKKPIAFFAVLIFAIHPLIIESVTWISGSNYSRSGFFFLLSLVLFYRFTKTQKPLMCVFSFISFIFSLGSLEKVIPLAIVFPLFAFLYCKKKYIIASFSFSLPTLVYLMDNIARIPERVAVLQQPFLNNHVSGFPFLYAPQAIGEYVKLFFFPLQLTLYHPTPEGMIPLILFFFFIIILLFLIKKTPSLLFWCVVAFASLSVTIYSPKISWIVAERYAYLFVLAIATMIVVSAFSVAKSKILQQSVSIIFTIIFLVLFVRSLLRNYEWLDSVRFWESTATVSAADFGVHSDLGLALAEKKNWQRAIDEFSKSIAINPQYAAAYFYRAQAYTNFGDINYALQDYQQFINLNPLYFGAYQNVGALYLSQKQFDKAEYYAKRAIELAPQQIQLKINLAATYVDEKKFNEARLLLEEVLALEPNNQSAQQGLQIIQLQE